jgi:hypothetical protein
MNQNFRDLFIGLVLGLIGNVVGFILFGLGVCLSKGVSFPYFVNNMFLDTEIFRTQIISGSLLVNLILFYILMRRGRDAINRGVVITILITMMLFAYYYI